MIPFLVNGFLALFLLDGALAVLNVTFPSSAPIAGLSNFLANLAWFAGFALYLIMAFVPRLPKRVLLPPMIFLLAILFAAMPLPIYVGLERTTVLLAWTQPAMGLLALALVRFTTRPRRWLFTRAAVEGPPPNWGHLLRFVAVNVLLIPVFVLYGAFCLAETVNHYTAGFLRLQPRGVQTEEREYVRGNQHVTLIGMVHIADAKFYRDVQKTIRKPGTIVLSEGVTDTNQVLRAFHADSYRKLASAFGLAQQGQGLTEKIAVRRADVDCSEFSEITIDFLNSVGRTLQRVDAGKGSPPWVAIIQEFFVEPPMEPDWEDLETIFEDVVGNRNARCLSQLDAAFKDHNRVVIPWGAMHMPGIEKGILEKGFVLVSRQKRSVIRW